jgi:hypothetical protein
MSARCTARFNPFPRIEFGTAIVAPGLTSKKGRNLP